MQMKTKRLSERGLVLKGSRKMHSSWWLC